ncbi:hypothetical protein [Streptosporangium saharense]|uniref:hypothetical protein n=1 Tax=Streptosporangium saharense TaxID=1706840 RepID=UPI00332A9605
MAADAMLSGEIRSERPVHERSPPDAEPVHLGAVHVDVQRDYRVVLAEDAVSGLRDIGRAEVTGIGVGLRSVRDITASLTSQEVS